MMNTIIKEHQINSEWIPNNCNILIVEDSKLINKVLTSTFSNLGYNCYSSLNLNDAIGILNTIDIDYILLDINLPDGSGYDIIQRLKESPTRIFVLSGATDTNFQEKTYEEGIIEFITKDHNFFDNVEDIPKKIERLEKNKLSTVLIVNSSLEIQYNLGMLLEERHYSLEFANNEKEALDIMLKKNIDLMLYDVQLNKSNKIIFLEKHKHLIINELNIRIIIISGHVGRAIMREGLKSGAVDVIKKPYVPEEIILKVNFWIDYQEKEKDIKKSTQLLRQYKETVDRSSIVSKSDSNNKITYVNEQFCKITGYTKDELIGNNYYILRHEDTPQGTFTNLWKTINEKKEPWEGVTKNKNKNGNSYWISSIINPILDTDGNIIEYITISQDVTDDMRIKKYFQDQINSSSKTLSQSIKTSNEYKRAMNESNIVSRTDIDGFITFANDEFCKISGYTQDELLGKSHNIVRHEDTRHEMFDNMWDTIIKGKTWKGIIKNKAKDGKTYWTDSTIIPIKDENDNITEYMSIRNDLTRLFELHEEIEHTQKEIIYRMGEIGETRSKETGNHVKRVASYSKILAEAYGLSHNEVDILFTASPMHDIGKVGISDEILKKPGKLTNEEFEIMKTHAEIGYNILKGSEREVLTAAAIVSKEHHEKWDGSGYPNRLKGENIHIYGRITAIADVFDALGSDRYYKKAWDDEKIFKLLKDEKGKHFDPKLIDLFFENINKIIEIRDKYQD